MFGPACQGRHNQTGPDRNDTPDQSLRDLIEVNDGEIVLLEG